MSPLIRPDRLAPCPRVQPLGRPAIPPPPPQTQNRGYFRRWWVGGRTDTEEGDKTTRQTARQVPPNHHKHFEVVTPANTLVKSARAMVHVCGHCQKRFQSLGKLAQH